MKRQELRPASALRNSNGASVPAKMNEPSHATSIPHCQLALTDTLLTRKLHNLCKSQDMPSCQSAGLVLGWRQTQKRSTRKRQRHQPQLFVCWVLSGLTAQWLRVRRWSCRDCGESHNRASSAAAKLLRRAEVSGVRLRERVTAPAGSTAPSIALAQGRNKDCKSGGMSTGAPPRVRITVPAT